LIGGNHYEGGLHHRQRLGQSLVGDARQTSPYQITFGDVIDWRLLCTKPLGPEDLKKFKDAIVNSYFFEMFIEDIPMWVRSLLSEISTFPMLCAFITHFSLFSSMIAIFATSRRTGLHW
jgi:hypothetical protein